MTDPFSSPWLYVLLFLLASGHGLRVTVACLVSVLISYSTAWLLRTVLSAGQGDVSTFPSISVALIAVLTYWILSVPRRSLFGIVSFALVLVLVCLNRTVVGQHTIVDVLGALGIAAASVGVGQRLRRTAPTPETGNSQLTTWPSRSYVPPNGKYSWTRAEVEDRYPGVLSPLFADLFFPTIGRAVQTMGRRLGVKKPKAIIGYRIDRGFGLSNMGPHILNFGKVLHRFLRIRQDALHYCRVEYPKAKSEFWLEHGSLRDRIRTPPSDLGEAYLLLEQCMDRFERWMVEHSVSLIYIRFGLLYVRAMVYLHHPLSAHNLLTHLPRGLATPSTEDSGLLRELGMRLGETTSWDDLKGEAAEYAQKLLDVAGDRTASYDFLEDSWRDNPDVLLQLARSIPHQQNATASELERWTAGRQQAEDTISRRICRVHPFFGRRLAQDVIFLSNELHIMKEERQKLMASSWQLVKSITRSIGACLTEAGTLRDASDVFFLTAAELAALVNRHSGQSHLPGKGLHPDLLSTARSRREQYHTLRSLDPQIFGTARGVLEFPAWLTRQATTRDNEFHAKYALPGTVAGPAVVIRNFADFGKMQPGHILVSPITNPHWDILFPFATGVVVERGGSQSHAMLKANEFALPTLVGLPGIVSRITDGDRIEIDGEAKLLRLEKKRA